MFEKITQNARINQLAWETIVLPTLQQLYTARRRVNHIRLEAILTILGRREAWVFDNYISRDDEKLGVKGLLIVLKEKRENIKEEKVAVKWLKKEIIRKENALNHKG